MSSPPSSPSVGEPMDMDNAAASLSIIFAVLAFVELTAPTLGLEIVAMTVSVASKSMSSITGTVMTPLPTSSGIVNVITLP